MAGFLGTVWTLTGNDRIRRPLRILVGVTTVAGIGHAELDRKIRSWNPDAVIPPRIYSHISFLRHMTFNALSAFGSGFVKMVRGRIV